MSRSEYTDDSEGIALYRASVDRAINGARGQAFLREMEHALDSMQVRRLAKNLVLEGGESCAMGAVLAERGLERGASDFAEDTAQVLGIAPALAREIAFENDDLDGYTSRTPEERHAYMLQWARSHLRAPPPDPTRAACGFCARRLTVRRGLMVWHKHGGWGRCPGAGEPPGEPRA
jgi:hypothetical protein